MEENEKNAEDKLQKFDVPKCIRILSVVYIAVCIVSGFLSLCVSVLDEGRVSAIHLQYVGTTLGQVLSGFIFWGIGQVFSKFMEKNK